MPHDDETTGRIPEPRDGRVPQRRLPAWLPIGAATILGSLLLRPPWRVDETRNLAVAWDMWRRHEFLVPSLNGEPYSHKPPLLYWLIHSGWTVLGVNEAWARLVPGLLALACLALTAGIARRLWPGRPQVARRAPLLLLACGSFAFLSTVLLFDLLLTACLLAALLAMLHAAQRPACRTAWLLGALAVGAGLLAKGPVLLLFLLPALLALPATLRPGLRTGRWVAGVSGVVLVGMLVALAWVVPAVRAGGAAYRDALLFSQTTRRIAGEDIGHLEPFWLYAVALPALLLPALPWRRLWGRRAGPPPDRATRRWLLAWMLVPAVLLSLVASKQAQYLAPGLPALAILGARRLEERAGPGRRGEALGPALLLALGGGAALALRAGWIESAAVDPGLVAVAPAVASVLLGAWLAWQRFADADAALLAYAAAPAAFTLLLLGTVVPAALGTWDVRPGAAALAAAEAEGRPLAAVENYRGDFDFHGRLHGPITWLRGRDPRAWAAEHPDGCLLMSEDDRHAPASGTPRARLAGHALLWDAAALLQPAAPHP